MGRFEKGEHRWSGWPGAYCLYCGYADANEVALAEGFEPSSTDRNELCVASQEARDRVDRYMNPEWFEKGETKNG